MVLKGKMKIYYTLCFLPLIAVAVFCIRYNQNPMNFFLPDSLWNDELLYYKTIEGIKEYGVPQGYFGYNESRAILGTFGAWSPVIYTLDAIWGSICGWNYNMPIVARFVFSSIAFLIYAHEKKPNHIECVNIILYVSFFTLYARYLMSQMADCHIIALMILFLAFNYMCEINGCKMGDTITSVLIVVLTLMRPYYILLWLVAAARDNEDKKSLLKHGIIGLLSLIFYFVITHYMTAAYFSPLINVEWLKLIIRNPVDGIKNMFAIVAVATANVCLYIKCAWSQGDDIGMQYFIYGVITTIFIVMAVTSKQKNSRRRWFAWCTVNILFLFAIMLFYDIKVGSRHLMPFIIAEGVMLLGSSELKLYSKLLLIMVVCYLSLIRFNIPYLTTLPRYNEQLESTLMQINSRLDEEIVIESQDRWSNTILWVISDRDGAYPWKTLYALPPGMGINICTYQYILENFEDLSAGYIACTAGGDIATLCRSSGYKEVIRINDQNVCIYKRL